MSNKTFVILKPDCVQRGLTGEVTSRFERKWFKLVASKMTMITEDILKVHYAHLVDKPFFPGIVAYMTSSPVVMQVWEGKWIVPMLRNMLWATNPAEAAAWTIRADYAANIWANILHSSENEEEAAQEIERFFWWETMHSYKRADETLVYES